MSEGQVWLARDADGKACVYSLLTNCPVLQPDGLVTTLDETAECLGVYSAEQAEHLFGVQLRPGAYVVGRLSFQPDGPVTKIQQQTTGP